MEEFLIKLLESETFIDLNILEIINDKNDDIPLLIIDVNIRQGVKKKIYVYEGDTAESIAKKWVTANQCVINGVIDG